ncbi:hypothetical protein PIB30_092393, partial [Stylosanthes scabra]|nr:hypothetical protein [Stylosanthes scabra]
IRTGPDWTGRFDRKIDNPDPCPFRFENQIVSAFDPYQTGQTRKKSVKPERIGPKQLARRVIKASTHPRVDKRYFGSQ